MSTATIRRLAKETATETEALLHKWHDAFERGDCKPKDVSDIMDGILDTMNAANKIAPPTRKKAVRA